MIYHEVLFQLALKNNIGGKIGEIAGNILTSLSAVWDKAAQAQDVIRSMAKERELFLLLSKEFKKVHIVMIDDLVAYTGEIKEKNKEIFDKYNEKVIDRIYHVTEKPEKINWRGLGIDEEFIKGFLEILELCLTSKCNLVFPLYKGSVAFCVAEAEPFPLE